MIIKTNEWGVTEIWPFIKDESDQHGLAFSARITVRENGTVSYHGINWTPEEFARLRAGMQKAFELSEEIKVTK